MQIHCLYCCILSSIDQMNLIFFLNELIIIIILVDLPKAPW